MLKLTKNFAQSEMDKCMYQSDLRIEQEITRTMKCSSENLFEINML